MFLTKIEIKNQDTKLKFIRLVFGFNANPNTHHGNYHAVLINGKKTIPSCSDAMLQPDKASLLGVSFGIIKDAVMSGVFLI